MRQNADKIHKTLKMDQMKSVFEQCLTSIESVDYFFQILFAVRSSSVAEKLK